MTEAFVVVFVCYVFAILIGCVLRWCNDNIKQSRKEYTATLQQVNKRLSKEVEEQIKETKRSEQVR